MKKLFGMRLFLNDEFISYDFVQMSDKYFYHNYKPLIYVDLGEDIDFSDEDV